MARLDRPRKKSLIATERDPGAARRGHQDQARLVADDLVFLDESSTQITRPAAMAEPHVGARLVAAVPRNHGRTTCLAALRHPEWDHPWSEGAPDRSLPSGCARSWYRPCDRAVIVILAT
ncbi:MAG: hypothetical protein M9947_09665 [Thermomicrobiales bacterium]|nr:hypothetical protein [Thermomicrobiales bacterium]